MYDWFGHRCHHQRSIVKGQHMMTKGNWLESWQPVYTTVLLLVVALVSRYVSFACHTHDNFMKHVMLLLSLFSRKWNSFAFWSFSDCSLQHCYAALFRRESSRWNCLHSQNSLDADIGMLLLLRDILLTRMKDRLFFKLWWSTPIVFNFTQIGYKNKSTMSKHVHDFVHFPNKQQIKFIFISNYFAMLFRAICNCNSCLWICERYCSILLL